MNKKEKLMYEYLRIKGMDEEMAQSEARMNKKNETIELLAKGLNYNLRYDTLADKILALDEIKIEKITYHTKGLGYAFTATVSRKEFIDKYRHEGGEVK